ncbi:hypothetical protein JOQ06_021401, partial [Pogonophryne albipinna]
QRGWISGAGGSAARVDQQLGSISSSGRSAPDSTAGQTAIQSPKERQLRQRANNPTCNKARCCCSETQRHVDPKRPHRQDLCGRCRGKRLSCESTFSFKYIL